MLRRAKGIKTRAVILMEAAHPIRKSPRENCLRFKKSVPRNRGNTKNNIPYAVFEYITGETLKDLLVKGKGTDVAMSIFVWVKVAKILMFNNSDTYPKLCEYEQRLWNEYHNPNSKIRKLIDKVRGDAK